jgi:hypothetical protein
MHPAQLDPTPLATPHHASPAGKSFRHLPDDDAERHAIRLAAAKFAEQPEEDSLRRLICSVLAPKGDEALLANWAEISGEQQLVLAFRQ